MLSVEAGRLGGCRLLVEPFGRSEPLVCRAAPDLGTGRLGARTRPGCYEADPEFLRDDAKIETGG